METVLHALALQLPGIRFVGHTHPTATNALTCSQDFEKLTSGRLFPDEIVYCGPAQAVVPWTDPGLPLARKVREVMARHMDDHDEVPKVVLMQNHGLIALGRTVQDVENITAMAVKAARVLIGTAAFGGPRFMTPEAVRSGLRAATADLLWVVVLSIREGTHWDGQRGFDFAPPTPQRGPTRTA